MRPSSAVQANTAVARADRGYRPCVRILLSVLLVFLLVPTWSTAARLALLRPHAEMAATPVALNPGDPRIRRVGRLTWLGGISLTSRDPAFGGFSSMHVSGNRFTLLSDGGNIVRFTLTARGRIAAPVFGNLPDGPGIGWEKFDRDSESMTVDPITGQTWIGFENYNAIWRYDTGFSRAQRHVQPAAMANWLANGGPEAMVRLHDGHFAVLSETAPWRGDDGRVALWFDGDPTIAPGKGFRFGYLPPEGYSPSDMTELPDGRLLVLNRRFALPYDFTAKLTIIDRAAIRPGALVKAPVIASFAAPLIHDNFEAVAATREGASTIVWIASDDNQSVLQRSLLLKFRLD